MSPPGVDRKATIYQTEPVRRHKRKHRLARDSFNSLEPRPRVVYLAVVHGIGVANVDQWAKGSIFKLIDWWTEDCQNTIFRKVGCPADCRLKSESGVSRHRHIIVRYGLHEVRLDLDAIYWGRWVQARSGRWNPVVILKTGLLVSLIDGLSTGMLRLEAFKESKTSTGAALSMLRFLALIPRCVASIALTSIAPIALVYKPLRQKLDHALAWGHYEQSRNHVLERVVETIRDHAGDAPIVLIGHSQGGSIAEEAARKLSLSTGDESPVRSVITLGSGHTLLQAMNRMRSPVSTARHVGLLIAWIVYLLLSFVAVVAFTGTTIHAFDSATRQLTSALGTLWLSAADASVQLLRDAQSETLSSFQRGQRLLRAPDNVAALFVAAVAGVFWTTVIQTQRRSIAALREAVTSQYPGIDIVANDDPVAMPMLTLGDDQRLLRISQIGLAIPDHLKYFDNKINVLPALTQAILRGAGFPGAIPTAHSDPACTYASSLARTRLIYIAATATAVVFTIAFAPRALNLTLVWMLVGRWRYSKAAHSLLSGQLRLYHRLSTKAFLARAAQVAGIVLVACGPAWGSIFVLTRSPRSMVLLPGGGWPQIATAATAAAVTALLLWLWLIQDLTRAQRGLLVASVGLSWAIGGGIDSIIIGALIAAVVMLLVGHSSSEAKDAG